MERGANRTGSWAREGPPGVRATYLAVGLHIADGAVSVDAVESPLLHGSPVLVLTVLACDGSWSDSRPL